MILITGAGGQIGQVLTKALQKRYGASQVLPTDIRAGSYDNSLFEILDVTDSARLLELIERYKVTEIYHLAAVLSARGESHPIPTWDINMGGLLNVLEAARTTSVEKVFFPSSIAVYGEEVPLEFTPQFGALIPSTVYGISKVAGESWCHYYSLKYDVDVRSLRFPGIIGYESLPGGGTTDYAVEIYHAAVKGEVFRCYISEDEKMPMIYMKDAIRAVIELMEAQAEHIKVRTSYNLGAMSFSPKEITRAIQAVLPDFKVRYEPDFRDKIAKSWPDQLDDQRAREDWGWRPEYDLQSMTEDMILHLGKGV